jgi:diadenylate cyclase
MTEFFSRITALNIGWRDIVDVAIVSFLLYNLLVLIRGTRAMQMLFGLLALFALNFLSQTFNFLALATLSEALLLYIPFAIIVLFQHEIRRALATFGRTPLVSFLSDRQTGSRYDAVVKAAERMSEDRTGALIVLERTQAMRMYTDSGKKLDALVSSELLVSIFTHNTPLHDGAVVIVGNRIVAAGVFLPLSGNTTISKQYGTRHRAALGLSEETDAFVVVVSEENGSIGVALDGVLYENLSPQTLTEMIRIHVGTKGSDG